MAARATLLVLVVLLAFVPAAKAHGAPDPPGWMTRLLHDYNDDWGGHDDRKDGHDLIALDLQEAFDPEARVGFVVFRFLMDGGYDGDNTRPELRDVLTFEASGRTITKELRTSDNARFEGTFDGALEPRRVLLSDGTRDGSRFFLDARLNLSTLDVAVGDRLSNFFVQGFAGPAMADHMVGGYTEDGRRTDAEPESERASPASYRRAEYALRGPVAYLESEISPTRVYLRPGDNHTISWNVENRIERAQNLTFSATKPDGVTVVIHGPYFSQDRLQLELPAHTLTGVHAYLGATKGSPTGTVVLSVDTDLGGHVEHTVTLLDQPDATSTTPKKSPGVPLVGLGLCLVVAFLLGGRRRD